MSSQTEMFDKGILEQDTTDDIILIDGVAYKDGVLIDSESMERGKLTWAVKAIKAVYKKLPARVKGHVDFSGAWFFTNVYRALYREIRRGYL